jgi:hypothetical protein
MAEREHSTITAVGGPDKRRRRTATMHFTDRWHPKDDTVELPALGKARSTISHHAHAGNGVAVGLSHFAYDSTDALDRWKC